MIQQFQMGEMKKWLLECFEEEHDQEQIKELNYNECVRAVNRYYDGGYEAFKECSGCQMEEVKL